MVEPLQVPFGLSLCGCVGQGGRLPTCCGPTSLSSWTISAMPITPVGAASSSPNPPRPARRQLGRCIEHTIIVRLAVVDPPTNFQPPRDVGLCLASASSGLGNRKGWPLYARITPARFNERLSIHFSGAITIPQAIRAATFQRNLWYRCPAPTQISCGVARSEDMQDLACRLGLRRH